MIGLATLFGGLARLPRPVWYICGTVLALLLLWRWHDNRVDAAFAAGGQAQAAADRQAFAQAASAAAAAQAALKKSLVARQAEVSKGTDHVLVAQNADLARRYDDLRLRWATYRADQGRAGTGGATAVPGTTGLADAATCTTQGWVSFDTAAAAAEAADSAIARDDAWRAWVRGQAAAWPGN